MARMSGGNAHASVVPESAQRLSGIHEHLSFQALAPPRQILNRLCSWVPVFGCAETGMTSMCDVLACWGR